MVDALFRVATVSIISSGESTFFWMDNWIQGTSIRAMAPALFTAVSWRRWNVTVSDALPDRAWVGHITGARTVQLLTEFVRIWGLLQHVQLVPGSLDVFRWTLSADGSYFAASAYGAMLAQRKSGRPRHHQGSVSSSGL